MAIHTVRITGSMETQRFAGMARFGDSVYGMNHGREAEVVVIPLPLTLLVNVMIG